MGQVRISMRKDIDAASYGRVEVSEIRGATPQPEDILLIAKKYMADPEPYKIVTLLTVDQAAEIRRSFAQPEGVAPRRVIQEKVRKKVENLVPACVEQGLLPLDGAAYLTNWVAGTLPKKPRPREYTYLTHRFGPPDAPGPSRPWVAPPRERHVDLSFQVDDDDDSASDDAYDPIDDED